MAVPFLYIVIVLAILFLFFYHKILSSENPIKEFLNKWQEFIPLCLSGVLAWILANTLKILFHTLRPFDIFPQVQSLFTETGYAFPSGHTIIASAIAFSLFFTHKKTGYLFMSFALLIGLARVAAGVHFPIDILGGFALGTFVAYFVAYFTKKA